MTKGLSFKQRLSAYLLCCFLIALVSASAQTAGTFANPIKVSGADPWVYAWNGSYYYMNSTGSNLKIWKTDDLTNLSHAESRVVWSPPPDERWSRELWAPEIYRWDGKWYVYFAADDGHNATHRIYVLENASSDPLSGAWTFRGEVSDASDHWAIDPDVFEVRGQHYMVWSGWKGDANGEQDIFLAKMSNPWTISSPRTMISSPRKAWETHGDLPHGEHVNVNEGPEALIHGADIFIVFSASGCWTDDYALGALRAQVDADLLDAGSWKKLPKPLLSSSAEAQAFGPGHNGFFKSPDGTQDWLIYHANSGPHQGCGGKRSPRIQPFTWNADGTPNFGTPARLGQEMEKPRGR